MKILLIGLDMTFKMKKTVSIKLSLLFAISLLGLSLIGCEKKPAAPDTAQNAETIDVAAVAEPEHPQAEQPKGPLTIKGFYIGMNIDDAFAVLKKGIGPVSTAYGYYDFPKDFKQVDELCPPTGELCPNLLQVHIQRELELGELLGNRQFPPSYRSINIGMNWKDNRVIKGRIVADPEGKVVFFEFKDSLIADLFSLNQVRLNEFVERLDEAYSINLELVDLNRWSYRDKSGSLLSINGWSMVLEKVSSENEQRSAFN